MVVNRTPRLDGRTWVVVPRARLHRIRRRSAQKSAGGAAIVTTLRVPKAGGLPTTKVNVVRWLKQEGEAVARGDALVELETEKVIYELDSPSAGILLKILKKEGAEVPVGEAVCHIGQPGDTIPQQG